MLDDAQKIYNIESFWELFKDSNCRLLSFATYSPSILGDSDTGSPVFLRKRFYYDLLKFSEEEQNDLVDKFKNGTEHGHLLTDEVVKHIKAITDGHPGLLYACLNEITLEFVKYFNTRVTIEYFFFFRFVRFY